MPDSSENALGNISNPGIPTPVLPCVIPESNPPSNSDNQLDSTEKSDDLSADLYLPIALRKGKRSCTNHPISNHLSYRKLSQSHEAFVSKVTNVFVPKNIEEALADSGWRAAVFEEIEALNKNGTWDLVEAPKGKKLVGCKWIFTVKFRSDGSVERLKARLVAKGFTQTYGIDYLETFAPVAKMNTVRILLSLAANFDWSLHQLDIKNAFLNGDLEEEVYMSLPPGFVKEYGENKVCRLRKSLYGLKQSPRAWFGRFERALTAYGYQQSQADRIMFYKKAENGKQSILIVYVDDIIIT